MYGIQARMAARSPELRGEGEAVRGDDAREPYRDVAVPVLDRPDGTGEGGCSAGRRAVAMARGRAARASAAPGGRVVPPTGRRRRRVVGAWIRRQRLARGRGRRRVPPRGCGHVPARGGRRRWDLRADRAGTRSAVLGSGRRFDLRGWRRMDDVGGGEPRLRGDAGRARVGGQPVPVRSCAVAGLLFLSRQAQLVHGDRPVVGAGDQQALALTHRLDGPAGEPGGGPFDERRVADREPRYPVGDLVEQGPDPGGHPFRRFRRSRPDPPAPG